MTEDDRERTKSPLSKLDSLSRDDLVKFVKKQTILLQKSRSKCEELQKSIETRSADTGHSDDKPVTSEQTDHQPEVRGFENRICELKATLADEREAKDKCRKQCNELEEELGCFKLKDETKNESIRCLQEELTHLSDDARLQNEKILTFQTDIDGLRVDKTALECSLKELNVNCDEKEERIISFKKDITDLSAELVKMESALLEKDKANAELLLALDLLRCESDKKDKANEELSLELTDLKTDARDKDKSIAVLQQEVVALSETVSALKCQCYTKVDSADLNDKEGINKLTSSGVCKQCDILFGEIEKLKCLTPSTECEVRNDLAAKIEQLESSKSELESELNSEKMANKNLHADITSICQTLLDGENQLNESSPSTPSDLRDICDTVKKQILTNKDDYRILLSQKSLVEYELTEIKEENDMLKNESDCSRQQLKEWEDIMQMLQNERQSAITACVDTESKINLYQESIQLVTASLRETLDENDEEILNDDVFQLETHDGLSVMEKVSSLVMEKVKTLNDQLNKAYLAKADVSLEVRALIDELATVKDEKESLQRELGSLTAIQSLSRDREFEAAEERTNLTTKLEEYEAKVHELEEVLSKVGDINEICNRKHELENERLKNTELERKLNDDCIDISELSTKLEDRHQYIIELENTVANLTDKLAMLRGDYEKSQREIENLHSSDDCQTSDYISEMKIAKERLEKEVLLLTNKLQEKNIEFEWLGSQYSTLTESTVEKDTKLQELSTKLSELSSNLKETEAKSDDLEIEKYSLDCSLKEKDKKLAELEAELLSTIADKNDLNGKIESYSEKIETLEQGISSTENEMNQAWTENEELKTKITALVDELSGINDEVTNLRMAGAERDQLKIANERLIETKQNFEGQLEHLQQERISLNEELLQLRNELDSAKKDFDNLANSESEMHQEMSEKVREVARLQQILQANDATILSLEKEKLEVIGELENLKATYQKSIEEISTENDDFASQLERKETALSSAQRHLLSDLLRDFATILTLENETDTFLSEEEMIRKCSGYLNSLSEMLFMLRKEVDDLKCAILQKDNEYMQSETEAGFSGQNQIDELQHEVKVKEDLCAKLKAIIVKSKREISDLNATFLAKDDECTVMRNEIEKIRVDGESKLKEAVKECETTLKFQLKQLQDEVEEKQALLDDFKVKLIASNEQLKQRTQELDYSSSTLSSRDEEIAKIQTFLDETILEKQSEIVHLKEEYESQIKTLKDELKVVNSQLTALRQEAKQTSMIDLEMADYERSMKKMHEQLQTREGTIDSKDNEIRQLNERISQLQLSSESSEKRYTQSEDRASKLKQLLVKAKKDLADAKKSETEQKSTDVQLRGQMENLLQQIEEYKVQLSELSNENVRLREKLTSTTEVSQRTVRTVEQKSQQLQETLNMTRDELTTVQTDYDGYKVRVHNVLKQQKTKQQHESLLEAEQSERRKLEESIEQLQSKLREINDEMQSVKQENEVLLEEQERLILQQQKVTRDSQESEMIYKCRIEKISNEYQISANEHADVVQRLTNQHESITSSFQDSLKKLQMEHSQTLGLLHKQIEALQNDNSRLLYEAIQRGTNQQSMHTNVDHMIEQHADMRNIERQSGEGMEKEEATPCAQMPPTSPQQGIIPFNQFLSVSLDDDMSARSVTSHDADGMGMAEVSSQQESLADANKRINHMTQLLSDSDVTVLRLTEQTRLLKDEIRRLERNQVREEEMRNMEYLKNILLKFLSLKGGEERARLIPVMTTMLKLSDDEKQTLQKIAVGEEVDKQSKSWGSYLYRWTSVM